MKTFTNHIAGINATGDQKALAAALDRFFASDASAFLMLGYAGTGKTFMLDQLAHFLRSAGTPFHLMAPTGRAAKVLAARTGFTAGTIHRSIYRMDKLCEYKETDQDGSETYKYFFDLGVNDDEANAPQFTRLTARSGVDEPVADALVPLLMHPAESVAATPAIAMPEEHPWLAALYHALSEFATTHHLSISDLRHLPYNECYTIRLDEITAGRFNIYYNSQQEISRVYPDPGNPDNLRAIAEELDRLLTGKRMTANPVTTGTEQAAPRVQGTLLPHHEQFCGTLQQALSESGRRMVAITVNGPYHLTCSFADTTGEASIHYYFNGREQLTRVTPHSRRSTSPTLLDSLLELSKKARNIAMRRNSIMKAAL